MDYFKRMSCNLWYVISRYCAACLVHVMVMSSCTKKRVLSLDSQSESVTSIVDRLVLEDEVKDSK